MNQAGRITGECKHCGDTITGDGPYTMHHLSGPQAGKARCAVNPYGFLAELVGTECGDHPANPCNGSRGIELTAESQAEADDNRRRRLWYGDAYSDEDGTDRHPGDPS